MGCVVKGYDERIAQEQIARNVAYLDQPEMVCGEPLRNITPHMHTVLSVMRTPFIHGGNFNRAHVAQFLWACHVDYSPRSWWRRRTMTKRTSRLSLEVCYEDIAKFLDLTFMDAPRGTSKGEKPIASDTAWLVYRFRNPPWNQSEQVTLHAPFRKLYQELRCWQKENGETIVNPSDAMKSEWLEKLQTEVNEGRLDQSDLDAWNQAFREGPESFEAWQRAYFGRN